MTCLLTFKSKYLWHDLSILKCFLLYHAVPLGSIQELPAESCSEIKASEGNEMVNGNYWLYSDGNGQTILARCDGAVSIC